MAAWGDSIGGEDERQGLLSISWLIRKKRCLAS